MLHRNCWQSWHIAISPHVELMFHNVYPGRKVNKEIRKKLCSFWENATNFPFYHSTNWNFNPTIFFFNCLLPSNDRTVFTAKSVIACIFNYARIIDMTRRYSPTNCNLLLFFFHQSSTCFCPLKKCCLTSSNDMQRDWHCSGIRLTVLSCISICIIFFCLIMFLDDMENTTEILRFTTDGETQLRA